MNSKKHHCFINTLVVIISLTVGLGMCELFLRVYAYLNQTLNANFPVYARDIPYEEIDLYLPGTLNSRYPPGVPFNLSIYDEEGVFRHSNFVPINNYGWISKYNYQVKKDSDEFRIALIGDSFTGTITNTRIWADTLQDRLNSDKALLLAIGKKRFTVMNFGEPGAGFDYFFFPLSYIAYQFSPDLVMVNFITEDIFRHHVPADQVAKNNPIKDFEEIKNRPLQKKELSFTLEYGDIRVPVICYANKGSYGMSRDCSALHWEVPKDRKLSQNEVKKIRLSVARTLSLHKTVLSKNIFLFEFMHKVAPNILSGDDISRSVKNLEYIKNLFPKIILTNNPTYSQLSTGHLMSTLEQFEVVATKAGFKTNRMEWLMPIQHDLSAIKGWYNLPVDGHFSDVGADLYAAAAHRLLRKEFYKNDEMACGAAFEHYQKGLALQRGRDANLTLKEFSAANAVLPQDATTRFTIAPSYIECGFLPDFYRQYAEALNMSGNKEFAKLIAYQAKQLQPSSIESDMLLIKMGMNRADLKKAIINLRKKSDEIQNIEARVKKLLQLGNLAATNGLNEDGVEIYREVLRLMPNHLPALEGIAGVLLELDKPQEALGWLNAAIVQAPNKPDIIKMMDQASKALNLKAR